jgi:hypothetical protein
LKVSQRLDAACMTRVTKNANDDFFQKKKKKKKKKKKEGINDEKNKTISQTRRACAK